MSGSQRRPATACPASCSIRSPRELRPSSSSRKRWCGGSAGCSAMAPSPFAAEHLLARVEEAGLNASVPPQQRLVDGWLLRFSPGKAKRARSIQAISSGRLPLADKLALCREVYAAARLPMLVRITPFCLPAGLDAALERLGMHTLDDTRV